MSKEYLQSQEILKRCFQNTTKRLKIKGFYSEQDYFNAVYDDTADALRVSFDKNNGNNGFLYWQAPVETFEDLPTDDKYYTVRLVTSSFALYSFDNDDIWKIVAGGSSGGSDLVVKNEGTTITSTATE
jgi:hypothetical protein